MNDNPFDVTKAVDFTDAEIAATWVKWQSDGAQPVANPRSPMPTFLTGGKGGGRTHLLRYFSYPLQRLRHTDRLIDGLRRDGYLGIYFRCGGLNSSRFADKGQSSEVWSEVFSYYMEIWLGRLVLDLIVNVSDAADLSWEPEQLQSFADAVRQLFDRSLPIEDDSSLDALVAALHEQQRRLDLAINNTALTGQLDVTVLASPGSMVFGIPQAAARHLSPFSDIAFVYLFDEYENLTAPQQQYVNTMIREKQLPARFLVGSRRYGLRTHSTLSAGEENREGSEYQLVVLEDVYRQHKGRYGRFCNDIVQKRLAEAGLKLLSGADDYFAVPDGRLEDRALRHLESWGGSRERPWIARLRKQMGTADHHSDADLIVGQMEFPSSPLHEKFAIFLLYRAWADGKALRESASTIRATVQRLVDGRNSSKKILTTYKHYSRDLYAQLLATLNRRSEYYGFSRFVLMSGYLPRNLLVILKRITAWSLFLDEQPFRGSRITLRAQREGVREASDWFLGDAKGLGRVGEETERAIIRLGSLFRDLRYADKPAEVECSSFSTDRQGLTVRALRVLDEAVGHSLILKIPTGRRDRNSRVQHHKYQLNPMLAPRFDLALGRRGTASFSRELLNSVFDADIDEGNFKRERGRMLSRLQPPFRREKEGQGQLELI